jgi:hypothetical protein
MMVLEKVKNRDKDIRSCNSSDGGNVNEQVFDQFKNADDDLLKMFKEKAHEMPTLKHDEGFDGNATFINVG